MARQELLPIAKPILFNTEMVKAILEGRKTVTRRVVKFLDGKNPNWTGYIKDGLTLYNGTNEPCNKKPPFKKGDYLYVRETWTHHENAVGGIIFKARCPQKLAESKKWHPSIHMPKDAARIFLKIMHVRVERLQDITEEQAKAEGIGEEWAMSWWKPTFSDPDSGGYPRYRDTFALDLWNSTIKKADLDKYGWEANPWVWVIEFERVEV